MKQIHKCPCGAEFDAFGSFAEHREECHQTLAQQVAALTAQNEALREALECYLRAQLAAERERAENLLGNWKADACELERLDAENNQLRADLARVTEERDEACADLAKTNEDLQGAYALAFYNDGPATWKQIAEVREANLAAANAQIARIREIAQDPLTCGPTADGGICFRDAIDEALSQPAPDGGVWRSMEAVCEAACKHNSTVRHSEECPDTCVDLTEAIIEYVAALEAARKG